MRPLPTSTSGSALARGLRSWGTSNVSDSNGVSAEQYRHLVAVLKQLRLPMALKKKEAAQELGIGLTALNRYIAAGLIQAIHYEDEPASHTRIPSSELVRFISERLAAAKRKNGNGARPAKTRATSRARVAEVKSEAEKVRSALRAKR